MFGVEFPRYGFEAQEGHLGIIDCWDGGCRREEKREGFARKWGFDISTMRVDRAGGR